MGGMEAFGLDDDVKFGRHLIEKAAVATVPASSFYHDPSSGRGQVGFSFPKKMETIVRGLGALRRLGAWPPLASTRSRGWDARQAVGAVVAACKCRPLLDA